jgi:hypothetical protein
VLSCSGLHLALSLLSCMLTAAASGDDFCVLRVIFPATWAASGRLPLDDPNSDFLEAEQSSAACGSPGDRGCDTWPVNLPPRIRHSLPVYHSPAVEVIPNDCQPTPQHQRNPSLEC